MAPKKGKKVEELDISLRGDKFHLFRLKQLLKYLVENNAEIKIYDNDGGQPLKYSANHKRGELGLHHLVAQAINVSEDSARKLINGPLTLSQFITNTDRVYDLGNTLDDISISYGNHLKPNEEHTLFREINFGYSYYPNIVKPDSLLTNANGSKFKANKSPFLLADNRNILKNSISESVEILEERLGLEYDEIHSPAINFKMNENELVDYLRHSEVNVKERVLNHLNELVDIYISKLNEFNPEKGFLPDYLDLSIISDPEYLSRSRTNLITTPNKLDVYPNDSELLKWKEWRYEFLSIFQLNKISFEEMDESKIALLLLCNFELMAIDEIIDSIINACMKQIRFTVSTSNTHTHTKTNVADLSIEKVIEILLYYQIKLPLNEVFSVETNSILNTPLKMHADEYATENYYTKFDLIHAIRRALYQYLKENIIQDLHGNPSLFAYKY